ncbi:hypothetical protein Ocin01_02731 [Orchesella cincta]|uniref:Uncharacterized protein n=1 Tax=Orchesella cincta TaxID=48709 RepID=A0A1D2NFA7_ORCCI|nr:hypothetical protein Ocin01_02731 [Orchesella cincta]
MKSYMRIRVIN